MLRHVRRVIDADDALVVDDPAIRLGDGGEAHIENGLRRLESPSKPAVDVQSLFEACGMEDEVGVRGRSARDSDLLRFHHVVGQFGFHRVGTWREIA